jgi:hypothetical protein
MPSVRIVVRTLIAGVLAIMGSGVAGPIMAAQAAPVGHLQGQGQAKQSSQTDPAASSPLSISIDSVSPRFAQPGKTIEVKGTVTNHTGGPLYGVHVQLQTSAGFKSRSQMESFQSGTGAFIGGDIFGAASQPTGTIHNGATKTWSASFTPSSAEFSGFGVYPIVAEALSSGYEQLATARTLLPYWPGSVGQPLNIAWVWPLIDVPQQSACRHTLASNELAESLRAGGRLSTLLSAGLKYSPSTNLTWALDPALLSDASTMTQRYGYKVGGNASCNGTTAMPKSSAAAAWLSQLRRASGDPMFITPYADPDVAALTYNGLDAALAQSYQLGEDAAVEALGSSVGEKGSRIAWPAEGAADASVLTSLAHDGHVDTTVLSSSEMPPATDGGAFTPDDAVTRAVTGIGTHMTVLLADSHISGLLGAASARPSAGGQFAVTQDFLAETAMIVAEAPNSPRQRSVVIAPPRRWDPSLAEAEQLLQLTSAPWLKPMSLSKLASGRPNPTQRQQLPSVHVAPHQLGVSYMNAVKSVRQGASLFQSLLSQPDPGLTQALWHAVAATESSAWRGAGNGGGWLTLLKLGDYFAENEKLIQIISKNKVLLAGNSGVTPVSVSNRLPFPVQVRVQATAPARSSLSIGDFNSLVTVQANSTATVRVPLHSAALGSTQIQLQLVTIHGMPLPERGATQPLSVESTRYGRALLVLIAAALGVLLLTSVVRWTRRALRAASPGGARGGGGGGESGPGGGNEDGVSGDSALGVSVAGSRPSGDTSPRATGRSGGTG